MYTKTTIIAALAGSAVAVTDLRPDRVRRHLLPRQTDILNPTADPCLNALATVYSNAPTIPPKVASFEMTASPQANPCSVSVPSDISADYASYTSAVISWVDANSASIMSALSQCSTLTDFATELPICTATGAAGGSAPKATGTGAEGGDSPSVATATGAGETGSGSAAGTGVAGSRNSPTNINAGARETGMVAAAVAAAGLVGAAALL
ncbi:hypothetical protein Cob_v008998 [Colletotrichum orbiculare MAFF 240422]|uniref:Uncharacterized protein n=1 Tax=Colletotrichum orbiculare (strain 104-T / ATCC 96160 / CBS 514.97 / LARS 414 / MAFF 240422) TaxID=1213857 RepID=N4VNS8_COLOR|nr:hypothetical protein Cob_v008998 [Colletotrichum orbiculare MAFF 240422]